MEKSFKDRKKDVYYYAYKEGFEEDFFTIVIVESLSKTRKSNSFSQKGAVVFNERFARDKKKAAEKAIDVFVKENNLIEYKPSYSYRIEDTIDPLRQAEARKYFARLHQLNIMTKQEALDILMKKYGVDMENISRVDFGTCEKIVAHCRKLIFSKKR